MHLRSLEPLSTATTWCLLLLMILLTARCCCCDYRAQSIHCNDKDKDFLRIPSFKLVSNETKIKMQNLSNQANESERIKKANKEANFRAARNARSGFIPDSKFVAIGSTISGTNPSSSFPEVLLPGPGAEGSVPLSHYKPAASPFFGLKRLPTEKTMIAVDHEDWKPITYSLASVIAKTTTASTKSTRKTKITKPKNPTATTARTTKTINSVFKLKSEPKTADEGGDDGLSTATIRTPMNSIIYGVPKAKEISSAGPLADLSLNKQDSVVHDINYYQALSITDGAEFKKSFVAINKASGGTDGELPDSTTVQLMGQYYSLNERNIKRQEESAAAQNATELTAIDTRYSITTAPEYSLAGNESNNKDNNNSKNNNQTVVPEKKRKEILFKDETINNQTEATSNIMDEARKDNTWLEIASSNSTSMEFGNQYRMNMEQEQHHQQHQQLQEQQNEKPLERNETTWPPRSSSSSSVSSEKETETPAARGTETGTGTATGTATTTTILSSTKAELDDIELEDETLVTIHTTATSSASTNDSKVTSNSTQPPATSKTTICVPMLVREKSSANPEVFMDVERVVCFPLPPEMDLNFGDMKNERNDYDLNHKRNDLRDDMNDDVSDLKDVGDVNDVLAEKVQTDFGLQSDFEEQDQHFYSKCSHIQQNSFLFVETAALLLLFLVSFQFQA